MKGLRTAELVALAAATLVACTSDSPEPTSPTVPVATTIELSATSLTLPSPGAESQLSATVRDQQGDPMTSAPVTWTSLDPLVATVAGGLVSGVAEGTTTITAASGTVNASASVTVGPLPTLQATDLCSDQPGDAIVAFEDANLEQLVRDSVGIDASEDLTCSAVELLTVLVSSSSDPESEIASLVGIQNLTGLDEFRLEYGAGWLTDLSPLSGLTGLSVLGIHAAIADVSPLTTLTGLEVLDLADNYIVDLTPLAELDMLISLNLDLNYTISDFAPLASFTNLDTLSLGATGIAGLGPLAGLSGLVYLELGGNAIDDLSELSAMSGLEYLGLQGNNTVSDLTPLSGLTSLRSLNASYNAVIDLNPLADLTNLVSLDLGRNSITDIGPLASLTSLTNLRLFSNTISDIGALASLTELTAVNLQNNRIVNISPLAGLTGLTTLSLPTNSITDVSALAGLTNLTFLDLLLNRSLANIQPLLDNAGLGAGDQVDLRSTRVICTDVALLEAKGVTVVSDCN